MPPPDSIARPAPSSRLGKAVAVIRDAGTPMPLRVEADLARAEERHIEALLQHKREGGVVRRAELHPSVTEDDYVAAIAHTLVVAYYLLRPSSHACPHGNFLDGGRIKLIRSPKISRRDCEYVASAFTLITDDAVRAIWDFFERIGHRSFADAIEAQDPAALSWKALVHVAQDDWLRRLGAAWYPLPLPQEQPGWPVIATALMR